MCKAGDRVVATAPHDGNHNIVGAHGKVVYYDGRVSNEVLVIFDKSVGGHEGGRAVNEDNGKPRCSWWVDIEKLKPEVVSLENI